jgi:hypothetical protein
MPVAATGAQTPTPTTQDSSAIPRYRYRIIGLYDQRTGLPVEGAIGISGWYAADWSPAWGHLRVHAGNLGWRGILSEQRQCAHRVHEDIERLRGSCTLEQTIRHREPYRSQYSGPRGCAR